jgi:hypothetical protein
MGPITHVVIRFIYWSRFSSRLSTFFASSKRRFLGWSTADADNVRVLRHQASLPSLRKASSALVNELALDLLPHPAHSRCTAHAMIVYAWGSWSAGMRGNRSKSPPVLCLC